MDPIDDITISPFPYSSLYFNPQKIWANSKIKQIPHDWFLNIKTIVVARIASRKTKASVCKKKDINTDIMSNKLLKGKGFLSS